MARYGSEAAYTGSKQQRKAGANRVSKRVRADSAATKAAAAYGSAPRKKGKPGPVAPMAAPSRGKGKLKGRLAKTTGTTKGEARGIMKNVRQAVRGGETQKAKSILRKSLQGGPRAGVARTAQRSKKARHAASKITGRIAARQTKTTGRRG